MASGAVPKIDFRDEKMRECTYNLRQMISSDAEAEIVNDCCALQEMNIQDAPAGCLFLFEPTTVWAMIHLLPN